MRHYQTDSAPAIARVLSLALLADGALDRSEHEWLERNSVLERLGIDRDALDGAMRALCEDLEQSSAYLDMQLGRFPPEFVDGLLDEVSDPVRRMILFDAVLELTAADGSVGPGERLLRTRMLERWRPNA